MEETACGQSLLFDGKTMSFLLTQFRLLLCVNFYFTLRQIAARFPEGKSRQIL